MLMTRARRRFIYAAFVCGFTIAALLLMRGFFVSQAQRRDARPQAPAFGPNISATDAVVFAPGGDVDSDGKADPGDTLEYTVTVTNSGPDPANNVVLNSELQGMSTLQAGSVSISPVAANDNFAAIFNVQLSVSAAGLLANDSPGQNPAGTITAFDTSSTQCAACNNVTVNSNGSFTYMPPASFTGTDTFTYTLLNAAGSSTGTVTIQVSLTLPLPAPMNDGFNNPDPPIETPFNTSLDTGLLAPPYTVLNNDTLNGGTLAVFGATGPTATTVVNGTNTAATQQGGTLLLRSNGTFVYTPAVGFSGLDGFFYKLQNASGIAQAQVKVKVLGGASSSPPIAVNDNYSAPQNQQFGRGAPGFLGNDTVNSATVVSHTNPANGTLVAFGTDGSFSYTPNAGFSGNDTFTYTLQNANGSSTATVTIDVNVVPTVTSTVPANGDMCVPTGSTITINFSEVVATTAAFSISPSIAFTQSPTDGNASNSRVLTPTAPLTPGTQYTVTMNRFQVADLDGHGPAANYTFSFTALPTPVAVNDGVNNPDPPLETPINTSIDTALLAPPYTVLNNDALLCGGTLALFGATGPTATTVVNGTNTAATQQGGTLLLRPDGTFRYTPALGFTGLDGFFYKLQNASGLAQAQVRVKVVSGTVAPTARAQDHPVHEAKISPETGETVTTTPAFTLPAGKSVKIVYRATVDGGPFAAGIDSIDNYATVLGSNFSSVTTETASIALDAAPDLQVVTTDGGATTQPGGTVSYTLNYLNVVPVVSPIRTQGATGVGITVNVPANSTFNAGASSPGWSCADGAPAATPCTFNVGAIAAGGNGAATFAVDVLGALPAGAIAVAPTATIAEMLVDTNGTDLNIADNTSNETTEIIGNWDGSASADWFTAANWSNDTLPASGQNVSVPNVANRPSISGANVTLNNLVLNGEDIYIAGFILTVNGTAAIGANLVTGSGGLLDLGPGATITRTTGQVEGTLRKTFSGAGPAFTFPVGTAGDVYSPVDVTVNGGAGQLAIKAFGQAAPMTPPLNTSAVLRRHWSLEGSGITADVVFHYLQSDVFGNEENYRVIRVTNGTTATVYPVSDNAFVTPANDTITVRALSSFSNWTAGEPLAPTAASVPVAGRVTTIEGRGIGGARVIMTDENGSTRTALTNPFGYYNLGDVEAGRSYTFNVADKTFVFVPRIITVQDELTDLDFTGVPRE